MKKGDCYVRINEKNLTDQLYATYEANVKYAALWKCCYPQWGSMHRLETRKSAVKIHQFFNLIWPRIRWQTKSIWRCWMFAASKYLPSQDDFKLPIEDFELSQAHTFFWDESWKIKLVLEQVIATADQELTSRKVAFLPQTPQQDGGQWDMVVSPLWEIRSGSKISLSGIDFFK